MEERINQGTTRRGFLKMSAAAATALAASGAVTAFAADAEPAASQEILKPARCFTGGCYSCEYDAHVRDGRIVNITPTKEAVFGRRPCLRGYAQVERLYADGRLKYPMKRKEGTPRGAGEWERISWDEAIKTITDHWKDDIANYGSRSVAFACASGNARVATLSNTRMCMIMQFTSVDLSVDWALYQGLHWVYGDPNAGIMTRPGNEPVDLDFINAKTIMNWGDNRSEAQAQRWRFMIEAKRNGTKIVTIDPNFTLAAQRSDKWYPIRPGADSALMLGMLNVIISEGLQDNAYLMTDTVAPYLINTATGKYLHMSDLGVEPVPAGFDMYGQPTFIDNYVVWQEAAPVADPAAEAEGEAPAAGPVDVTMATAPVMEGTFTIDGMVCKTAFTMLKEHVAQYTLEKVSDICDMPASDIVELAHIAVDGPVTHIMGLGNQAYNNGIHVGTGIGTLLAVTGMVGKPGAGFEQTTEPVTYNQMWLFPTFTFSTSVSVLQLPDIIATKTFQGQPYPEIRSIMIKASGLVGGAVNMNKVLSDIIDKVDLVVCCDVAYGDCARYSDILLPAAQTFEIEDIYIAPLTNHMQYVDKVVDPAFEAVPDPEIIQKLAEGLGIGDFFAGGTPQYLDDLLNDPRLAAFGINRAELKKRRWMRFTEPSLAYQDHTYATPSGKVEFYVEAPAARIPDRKVADIERVRMTTWEEPIEAWPGTEAAKKYPLQLISERARYRWHSQGQEGDWLNEIAVEPTLRMNAEDAAARGINDGDYVEVYNDRGHAVAKAVICAGMRKGCMSYPKGWQNHQYKAGNFSELSHNEYEVFAVNSSFFDTQVEMRKWTEGSVN